ncbi:MAG: aminotransferase class III-fold pyridoxal phosphate-dependent enzyme [Gammaproteobacteria bacterium]
MTPSTLHTVAERELKARYRLAGSLSGLPGEQDDNLLLTTVSEQRFVLKIMHAGCSPTVVDMQCKLLRHINEQTSAPRVPHVIPDDAGSDYSVIEIDGESRLMWLLEHVPGCTLNRLPALNHSDLEELGERLAQLGQALGGFDHRHARREQRWNLTQAGDLADHCGAIEGPTREIARSVLTRFDEALLGRLLRLPAQVIHNDANDHNLLYHGDGLRHRFAALIDFGDAAWQPAICELAIAAAYVTMNGDDPIGACASLLRGYARVRPLTDSEIELLPLLIKARLAVSIATSSERQRANPDDAYIVVSQAAAKRLLMQLHDVPEALFVVRLRQATGRAGLSWGARVSRYISTAQPFPAIDVGGDSALVLDLGVGSTLLGANPANANQPALTARIDASMREAAVAVCVGRYLEPRLLYESSSFGADAHPCEPRRTVHLGLDVFCVAGTQVRAPLGGTVHRIANIAQPLDYGPMVMLRHHMPDGESFYTLYGHLDLRSTQALSEGQTVAAGEALARVGSPPENGGWPPHLHLQLILDDLDLAEQFPGVCVAEQTAAYSALSPNPAALLGIGEASKVDATNDHHQLHRRRDTVLGSALSLAYDEPLHMVRGFGAYLYDAQARAHLDIYNNVAHVGHSHPHVVDAVSRQVALLNTNTRYLHRNILDYAERLTAYLPNPLSVCFFVNSASEANELALRMARLHTGRRDMMVAQGAYHGHTSALIDMSPYKYAGPGGAGRADWVHEVPVADDYRGEFRRDDPDAGAKYAGQVSNALRALPPDQAIAGFIAETLPSVGGQIVLPDGYLSAVYAAVRDHGGLCIADEVQTGFGRLGDDFWGFSDQHVVPDIVVLGKPIANGFPMGAVVTTPGIARSFDNGMEFFATFGGNPVACAAASAVLDVVESENLQQNAAQLGAWFLQQLAELKDRHSIIGDVRGRGFFLGIELVHDRTTLAPAPDVARYVSNRLRDARILAGTDGPLHNVIKMRPTMVTTRLDLERVVDTLNTIFSDVDALLGAFGDAA